MRQIKTRLDKIETRLDGLEKRMDGMEKRLDRLEDKLDKLLDKVDAINTRLADKIDSSNKHSQILSATVSGALVALVISLLAK